MESAKIQKTSDQRFKPKEQTRDLRLMSSQANASQRRFMLDQNIALSI